MGLGLDLEEEGLELGVDLEVGLELEEELVVIVERVEPMVCLI